MNKEPSNSNPGRHKKGVVERRQRKGLVASYAEDLLQTKTSGLRTDF
jgi:hypothetical protein